MSAEKLGRAIGQTIVAIFVGATNAAILSFTDAPGWAVSAVAVLSVTIVFWGSES